MKEQFKVEFRIPLEMYQELKKMFFFRGEITKFLTLCVQEALRTRERRVTTTISELVEKARKEFA
jgi:hypothetical protein